MGKGREIKGRMKAVANIQRITKTMQMIATARFQASQRRATAAGPYTRKIAQLVGELASAGGTDGPIDHPLLRPPKTPTGRQVLLVLTSNRGLCGGYNANILRMAGTFLRDHAQQQVDLEIVGKRGLAYFKFAGTRITLFHSQLTDTVDDQEIQRLADRYMALFTDGAYDAVRVVYMAFNSVARQSPRTLSLLPMDKRSVGAAESNKGGASSSPTSGLGAAEVVYDFLPPPDQLLDQLLPEVVRNQLLQCFREAIVSEHIARMVAMKSATDSAGKMRKELTRQYNRVRQAAITTELSEIIAGSVALQ